VSLDWKPPILETERLILRPITPEDAPAVFDYASNPNMTRFTLFETHQTIDESRWFVNDHVRSRYACKEPDPFAITLKGEPDRMVGALGAHWVSQPNGTMEMGYALAEPHWGKGLVVEAAAAVIGYVFTEYAVERLQARVFVGHNPSERVLQKLGFTREGVLRSLIFRRGAWHDLVIYSLLREEWEGRATRPAIPGRPG
jgi:[ribosomal protein S5]-alanine N-acetyltransferase